MGTAGFSYSGSLFFTTNFITAQRPHYLLVTTANLVRKDSFIQAVNLVNQMGWHFRHQVSQTQDLLLAWG